VREFKRWVKKEFPSEVRNSRHDAGRKGLRDSLNRLGAMRLRYCGLDFVEAKAKINFGRPIVYTQERSMRLAADATELEVLRKGKKVFCLRESRSDERPKILILES